jgi:hypothetical protein
MYIKLGDIVKVLGMNDEDQLEDWYGEVVGRLDADRYEIYYIEHSHADVWTFNENYEVVEKTSINEVSRTKHGDYSKSWMKFGFELVRSENRIELHLKHKACSSTDSDGSESLDSLDSWSSSESDTHVSDLIDDSALELVQPTTVK